MEIRNLIWPESNNYLSECNIFALSKQKKPKGVAQRGYTCNKQDNIESLEMQ